MSRKSKIREKGFTLVELLIVVAIIAVLLSVLVPTLNKARGMAKSVTCLSQLKQIGLAYTIYAEDHSYRVVSPRIYLSKSQKKFYEETYKLFGGNQVLWWDLLVPYLQKYAKKKKSTVFYCLAEGKGEFWDDFDGNPWTKDRQRIPDYAINNCGLGDLRADPTSFSCKKWLGDPPPSGEVAYWKEMVAFKTTEIKMPYAYVLAHDFMNFTIGADPSVEGEMRLCQYVAYHTQPGGLYEQIYGRRVLKKDFCRHNDGMNFVFVDGHAKNLKCEYLGLKAEWAFRPDAGPIHDDIIWNKRDYTIHKWEDH